MRGSASHFDLLGAAVSRTKILHVYRSDLIGILFSRAETPQHTGDHYPGNSTRKIFAREMMVSKMAPGRIRFRDCPEERGWGWLRRNKWAVGPDSYFVD